jgi:hypothetical protein
MISSSFPPHGEIQLSLDGQILNIHGRGPVNMEAVIEYQTQVQQFRDQIMHTPWASLVLLSGVPLVTADAKKILSETVTQAKTMQLLATAVVFVDVEFADTIKLFWDDVLRSSGVECRFFDDETRAKNWLLGILEASE